MNDLHAVPGCAVDVRSVSVRIGTNRVLDEVTLDAAAGTLTVVAGPNGAGKSTLLDVIAGLRRPSSGSSAVQGAVAFVPQRTSLTDDLPLTVRDVVTIGAWGRAGLWRPKDAVARALIESSLRDLGIASLAGRPFRALSGGQRQRALLAQGLARGAAVLLLDEPTTGLDADSAARILTVMRREVERGATLVCVSHDADVLAAADVVVRLEAGRVSAVETPTPPRRAARAR